MYGVSRYYSVFDQSRKDSNGYKGVYSIMDRQTCREVCICDNHNAAHDKMKELEKKEREAKGVKFTDIIEIPYSCRDKNRTATEVSAVVVHK